MIRIDRKEEVPTLPDMSSSLPNENFSQRYAAQNLLIIGGGLLGAAADASSVKLTQETLRLFFSSNPGMLDAINSSFGEPTYVAASFAGLLAGSVGGYILGIFLND